MIFLVQNSFPMREWHIEHMEKTIIKFVTGLSANANSWEKRLYELDKHFVPSKQENQQLYY